MRTTFTALMALGVLAFVACDDDPAEPEFATLELSFNGLEPLEDGFHYEGWAIIDGSALGDDFTGATGSYILATPTNGADTDENSGIWFLSLASGNPAEGLDLPILSTAIENCTGLAIENVTLGGGDEPLDGRFLLCSCPLSSRG